VVITVDGITPVVIVMSLLVTVAASGAVEVRHYMWNLQMVEWWWIVWH